MAAEQVKDVDPPVEAPTGSRGIRVALIGGVIAIAGTLLDWWSLTGTRSPDGNTTTESGISYLTGFGLALISLVAVVLSLIMWVEDRAKRRRWITIMTLVVGTTVLLISAYSALAPGRAYQRSESRSAAEAFGTTREEAGARIRGWLDDGELRIEAEVGTYVSTLGGALIVAGAGLQLSGSRRDRAATREV
jgi:hypothetical protein